MSSDIQPYILDELDAVIDQTVANIGLYTKNPSDFTRNRKLNATTTIKVTLNMQGNSLNAELLDAFPNLDERMTASAYEQAKDKLKPEIFEHILQEYNTTMHKPKLLGDKYRVFAIDGSDFTTPYNKDSAFVMNVPNGRPRKNGEPTKPYCQVHENLLYDIENRIYQDCILQPKSSVNERDAAIDMLKRLDCGKYIVIMDRGYDGFNMIETCNRLSDCYYIIRTKAGKFGGIREITNLPDKECDMEMTFRVTTSNHYYNQHHNTDEPSLHLVNHYKRQYKSVRSKNTKDQRWDFEQFVNVKCRVVKFRINNFDTGREEWEVLLTNLNRFEFPILRMKEMYHKRWDIETSFRELKYALGGINFHSKKDDFIKMELFAHFIMFNAVSRSIACVSVPQTNHKYPHAIDFKMACLIVRKYYRLYNEKPPDAMFAEILAYMAPVRAGRSDKRNLKPKSAVWFVYRVA
ncbi:IS4 family transposase [Desulfotomaculum sp. OF05-3]|jgi:hypothetical protein|uniref:IS4 family transposase n=1 Tax=Desulfotomaculum sp. OF05-3 TaxID=2305243 RepID=UPI000E425D76|nr:IS4 family transposase [Desulfotomaculum sp. OF05-3]RGE17115.1 IS4 family transposase [Desulfotomaculum sp. OF05-3]